jgi:hypothetical protein
MSISPSLTLINIRSGLFHPVILSVYEKHVFDSPLRVIFQKQAAS